MATRYRVEKDADSEIWRVRNLDAPLCPKCKSLCSGYDTRSRKSIDGAGVVRWFSLRRLRCLLCNTLHIEIPDFMQSGKHYEAKVISDALTSGNKNKSPADDSTVRRWRKKRPPTLPVNLDEQPP